MTLILVGTIVQAEDAKASQHWDWTEKHRLCVGIAGYRGPPEAGGRVVHEESPHLK